MTIKDSIYRSMTNVKKTIMSGHLKITVSLSVHGIKTNNKQKKS